MIAQHLNVGQNGQNSGEPHLSTHTKIAKLATFNYKLAGVKEASFLKVHFAGIIKDSSIKHNTSYQIPDLHGRNKVSESPQYKTIEIRKGYSIVIQTILMAEASYN